MPLCRDATAEHLAVHESKRQYIEARKAAELAGERTSLAAWQTGLPGGQGPAQGPAAACRPQRTGHASAAGRYAPDGAAHNDPAYHGRGTLPPTSAQGSTPPSADATERDGNSGSASHLRARRAEPSHGRAGSSGAGAVLCGSREADAAPALSPAGCPARRFKLPPPPPRAAAQHVLVEFTPLQTRHLPARAAREASIRAYRQAQQVLARQGRSSPVFAAACTLRGRDPQLR